MYISKKFIIEEIDQIDSTMSEIFRRVKSQNATVYDTLLIAKIQTNGRGRNAKMWHSNATENLYMSFCVNQVKRDEINFLPIIIALSIKNSINDKRCKIKWPNDLMICDRKVSGILIESYGKDAIVGIGINIDTQPESLTDYATNLKEMGIVVDKKSLTEKIIDNMHMYINLIQKGNKENIIKEYKENIMYLREKIIANLPTEKVVGILHDIDINGKIILKTEYNDRIINSGDIYKITI